MSEKWWTRHIKALAGFDPECQDVAVKIWPDTKSGLALEEEAKVIKYLADKYGYKELYEEYNRLVDLSKKEMEYQELLNKNL